MSSLHQQLAEPIKGIAYFFVVEVLIKPFDRIILPELGLPLSTLLVAQGLVVLFGSALYLAARTIHKPTE